MRRIICIVLCVLSIATLALADTPRLSDSLFTSAKKAVKYLSANEFDLLETKLPFGSASPSADQWESFSGQFSHLDHVQTDYAVAFWAGSSWVIAVPVQIPDSGSVEVLAFSSKDGAVFDDYRRAKWSQVEKAVNDSGRVIWNKEYVGDSATIEAD